MEKTKLLLREFNEDSKHWREFWSGFESAVHSQDLPDVQKLDYVLARPKGPALALPKDNRMQLKIITSFEKVKGLKRFRDPAIVKRLLYSELRMIKRNE